mgnify:CR=1 FL=1
MGCLFGFLLSKGDEKMTIRSKMLGTVAAVFLVLFLMVGVVYLWGGSTLSSVLKGAGVESVSQSAQIFRGILRGPLGLRRIAAVCVRELRGGF